MNSHVLPWNVLTRRSFTEQVLSASYLQRIYFPLSFGVRLPSTDPSLGPPSVKLEAFSSVVHVISPVSFTVVSV